MDVNITNLYDLVAAINALAVALTDHSTALAAVMTDITSQVIMLVLVLAIAALAYWHRDRWLYVLSGLAFITFAVDYIRTDWYIGFILILCGIYGFVKAALERRN